MPQMLVGELILDRGLYPRSRESNSHIMELAQALRAGAVFPAVIIDRASRKIVDGVHRTEAARRVHGELALVEVEEREYESDAALFLAAVELNSRHGLRLTPFDQAKVITMSKDLQIDGGLLSQAMSVLADRVQRIESRKTAFADGKQVPIKGIAAHLRGSQLNPAQAASQRQAAGVSVPFLCRQLVLAMENQLVDTASVGTMVRLRELHDLLGSFLAVHVPLQVEETVPEAR